MASEASGLLRVIQGIVAHPLPRETLEKYVYDPVILPILRALGWDVDNETGLEEVSRESGLRTPTEAGGTTRRADVELYKTKGIRENVALIEVKRPAIDLSDKIGDQLYDYYTRVGGVDLCVLTNSHVYWLYYPRGRGKWKTRKFMEIDLLKMDPEDSATELQMFLGKSNLIGQESARRAERALRMAKTGNYLENELPRVWSDILRNSGDAHDKVLRALSEIIQEEHGITQVDELLDEFLRDQGDLGTLRPGRKRETASDSTSDPQAESTSRKRGPIPTAFTLLGQTHQSKSRLVVPIDMMKLLWADRSGGERADFEKLKTLSLGKYFSSTIEELDSPSQIGDSDFYLEKNRDAIDLLKAAYFLLEALGYEHSDLAIEYPEGVVGPGTKLIPGNEDIEVEVPAPRPISFVLLGEMTSTSSHSHIAQSVYDTMFETHGDRFSGIENHPENRRAIVSQTPEELASPRAIGDSGYYLDVNLFSMKKSLDGRLWTCHQLLGELGYSEDDFEIHPEPEPQD